LYDNLKDGLMILAFICCMFATPFILFSNYDVLFNPKIFTGLTPFMYGTVVVVIGCLPVCIIAIRYYVKRILKRRIFEG